STGSGFLGVRDPRAGGHRAVRDRGESSLARGTGKNVVGASVEILLQADKQERHRGGILRESRAERLKSFSRRLQVALLTGSAGDGQEVQNRNAVGARQRAVVGVLGTGKQALMVAGCEEEASLLRV